MKNTKIRKKSLIICTIFFFIIMPEIFTQYKFTAWFFAGVQILIFLYFGILKNKDRYPNHCLIWIGVSLYLLLVMVMNGNVSDIDRWGRLMITVLDSMLVIDYYIEKGRAKELLSSLSFLGVLYFFINTLSFILFSQGILDRGYGLNYYFLGLRTDFLKYFFPFLLVNGLNYLYLAKAGKLVVFLALATCNFFVFDVSTAMVCLMVIVALVLLYKSFGKLLNIKNILIFVTLINLAFLFFGASSYFAWFIETVLKRDITLTNRIYIWQEAIRMIFSSKLGFVLGNGIVNSGSFVKLGRFWAAHNQLLQWIFEYGLVGTSMIYMFFIKLEKKVDKGKDSYLVCIIFFAMMVASISSAPFINQMGYVTVSFIPYIPRFRQQICGSLDLNRRLIM